MTLLYANELYWMHLASIILYELRLGVSISVAPAIGRFEVNLDRFEVEI